MKYLSNLPIILFLFAVPNSAAAHGEEVIILFGVEAVAFLVGLTALVVMKASRRQKFWAAGLLFMGLSLVFVLSQIPYQPNRILVSAGGVAVAFCSVAFSILLQRRHH